MSDHGLYFSFGLLSGIVVCTVTYYILSWIKDFAELIYIRSPQQHSLSESKPSTAFVRKSMKKEESDLTLNDSDALIKDEVDTYKSVISKLESELLIKGDKLEKIVSHMISEMKKGLCYDDQSLKMLPSFVTSRPTGTEIGTVLALDCGGSNFRVCLVTLEGQGLIRSKQGKYVLPEDLKAGSGVDLFNFFADSIRRFLDDIGIVVNPNGPPKPLGFTFSFPVKQTSIDEGFLIQWNKGFTVTGVCGLDVADLLNEALRRKNLNIEVTALVNDTVGTLVAHSYKDPQTYIGVILGTGTNAAYVEKVENIKKTDIISSTGEIIINTEWGAYNEPSVLPITKYDTILDRQSVNPKIQIFEKMIAGMYLGELVRIILIDLIDTGELFRGTGSDELNTPYGFDTAYMSRIERDHTLDLTDTKSLLEDIFNIKAPTSLRDRRMVKRVCELVGTRAARLSAAGIAALVTKTNRLNQCTVAIDGSLFEHYPHFGNRMRDALREMLGLSADNILLEQARDGSGQGAALIAALAWVIKAMPALSEEDIQSLFMWIDEIPLSRPKKNLTRDFGDGVLAAEVVKHFAPKLIDVHNYAPANSIAQKIYNWSTLNEKVFRKLGYCISDTIINAIVNCKPGYIEYLLFELRQKIEEYLIHKPAMSKLHVRKHKSARTKQNSVKSTKSDQSSESERTTQSQEQSPTTNRYPHDANNLSNSQFIQQGYDDHNDHSLMMASPVMAQGGYPPQSPKAGYSPNNYVNVSSMSPSSLGSLKNPNSKPRVVIQEPTPYYKTPKTINNDPVPMPDYGREIAETLKMMQIKMEKLETIIELKDKKIDELTKRLMSQ